MERSIGTVARGLRAPIIKQGDDLVQITVDTVLNASKREGFPLRDLDVVAITESLLARAQGNYVHIDQITKDLNSKYDDEIGVVFPILSRNRFSIIMKAIVNTHKKVVVFLSYPSDEVGNSLIDQQALIDHHINNNIDTLTEERYREVAGDSVYHPFTGIDYVDMYKSMGEEGKIEIYLTNNLADITERASELLVANIHDADELVAQLKANGAKTVYSLEDILTESIDGSGYNPEYGLYGSNLSTDDTIKLFPRDSQAFVEAVQARLNAESGKQIEVMVYGDGAFKDPVGHIWELADPVVSPGYTSNLVGTPNELKLKYIADTDLTDMDGEEAIAAMRNRIASKETRSAKDALGTTPRRLTDLLGSLSDLVSGSGDKGTPIVLIQGYFDNFADE